MKKINVMSIVVIIMTVLLLITTSVITINYKKSFDRGIQNSLTNIIESGHDAIIANTKKNIEMLTARLENCATSMYYNIRNNSSDTISSMLIKQQNQYNLGELSYYSINELSTLYKEYEIDTYINLEQLLSQHDYVYLPCKRYGKTVCIILTPVRSEKTLPTYGILCSLFTTQTLNNYLFSLSTQLNATSYITTEDGLLLSKNNSFSYTTMHDYFKTVTYDEGATKDTFINAIHNKECGYFHYIDGMTPYYAYYTPLPMNNWYLVSIINASTLDPTMNTLQSMTNSMSSKYLTIIIVFECLMLLIQIFYYISTSKMNNRLILEKQKYDTVIKHSHGVIWEYDIQNDTMKKADKNSGVFIGLDFIENFSAFSCINNNIHPDDLNKYHDFCYDLKSGKPEIHSVYRAKDKSNNFVWFELVGITLYKNNIPTTVIGKSTNIDRQQREYEKLKHHAEEDPLTKLYNRTTAKAKINSIIESSELSTIHAFCMIDIDNFKHLNDNLGHTFGDAVLIEFSAKLSKLLGPDDFAFRIGGDEFAVFLRDVSSIDYVEKISHQICSLFKELLLGDCKPFDISGSIGVSLYPNHGANFDELFSLADIALYHSKGEGKDCYTLYSKETMGDQTITPGEHKEANTRDTHTLLDNTLLSNVIDVLFDAKDLNFTINFILSLIGSYYNLECLGVCEYTSDYKYLLSTYQWHTQNWVSSTGAFEKVKKEESDCYAYYKTTKTGVFYCRDINSLECSYPAFIDYLKSQNIQSFIQCAIADSGSYTGYIYANIASDTRQLEKHEIETISFISKIIGGYIRKLRSEEIARLLAKKDLLTGSYNISSFYEEAENILYENHYDQFALFYFDINRFKQINEAFGYNHGDNLLADFSIIFQDSLHENELFGRIIGDRFLLLLHYDLPSEIETRVQLYFRKFDELLSRHLDYSKLSLIIGIYLIEAEDRITIAIDRANIARKSVRERHKNNYAYFNETMKNNMVKRQNIENIMVASLKKREFQIYYQPKFNLLTNEICGAEALIRWIREEGIIYPGDFIPTFEDNGFIIDIDFYVFEEVCKQLRYLIDHNYRIVPVSVNFSRLHFRENTLPNTLQRILKTYNISPDLIEIEITESAMTDNSSYLLPVLDQLGQQGFRLSMDDFGSGYSSLNALRNLPFDILKLDKNFFRTGSATEKERIVISNIVHMARDLKMEIISEGVETTEQAEFLKSIGCNYAQGYLFAKPMPAEEYMDKYLLS
ncbi:EAL domain-containing protein [Anaerosporobacter faecicola]|uniref:EAL domain-containing protein n=1 Tax=Anaerosporobacter faecicola TaxID=2718714 RepID=UPI00143C3380|nr:EAL domain-containing protein [Anaerosporobacter faecicola]